jgi:hypothetical protein
MVGKKSAVGHDGGGCDHGNRRGRRATPACAIGAPAAR